MAEIDTHQETPKTSRPASDGEAPAAQAAVQRAIDEGEASADKLTDQMRRTAAALEAIRRKKLQQCFGEIDKALERYGAKLLPVPRFVQTNGGGFMVVCDLTLVDAPPEDSNKKEQASNQ